jgi:hypothetical protein
VKTIYHDAHGMITGSSINMPVDSSRPNIQVNIDLAPDLARQFYVRDGALVAKGPKPTDRSQFNYVVGAWYEPPISEAEIEEMRLFARSDRNSLLSACDWTQVADAPVDREAWAAYRQALRDVTLQDGFPLNIIWPNPPES